MTKSDTVDSFEMRYLDLSDFDFGAITMATEDQRWEALAKLGIERPEDQSITPLRTWTDAMLIENGFPELVGKPIIAAGVDIMFATIDVRNWVWFLA